MAVCQVEETPVHQAEVREGLAEGDLPLNQEEFDFVEPPSEDFFCPVTFEFLLNPHQTRCCGHNLSERAVNRLERDRKPCPMCKEPNLVTMPDKFFKRKTSAVLIRCPHKASGCEWVGEVGVSKQHIEACPKRAWKCQHCDFESTFEVGIQHEDECTKYPVPCPNKCEVRLVSQASPSSVTRICMIPRCDIEKHRAECPLELVACGFAEIGCKVKTTRQDLKRHMEESQQEHLLSATILNLRLTKETIAEKDRQLAEKEHLLADQISKQERQLTEKDQFLAEKDRQLAEKDRQLVEKDKLLGEKDHQLAEQLAKKDRRLIEKDQLLAEKDRQLAGKDVQLAEKLAHKDQQLIEKEKSIAVKHSQMLKGLVQLQQVVSEFTGGINCHRFTLENFSECQKNGSDGDWFSEPFDIDSKGYRLQLNVETREYRESDHMQIRLKSRSANRIGKVFVLALQMLNQQNNFNHLLQQFEATTFEEGSYSYPYRYIRFKDLYKRDDNIQYLKDDCLKFVLWIKEKK